MSDGNKGFWELMQKAAIEEFKKLSLAKGAKLIGFSYVGGEFQFIYTIPGDCCNRETFWANARGISEKLLQTMA